MTTTSIRPGRSLDRSGSWPICTVVLALAGLHLCFGWCGAQEQVPTIRRILVPVERPGEWPEGDWRPVPLADLERALGNSSRREPPSALVRADYWATLAGSGLEDGRLEWRLRAQPASGLLDLSPLGLAIPELRWLDAAGSPEADWGTNAKGRPLLSLRPDQTRIGGRWSLLGRTVGDALLFEVAVPRAVATTFHLRLPADRTVRSSAGDAQPAGSTEGGWREWTIPLGSQARSQWIVAPETSVPGNSVVLVRQETEYLIRQDGLRFQTTIVPEVLGSPLSELRLEVDPNLNVLAVSTPGGVNLPWRPADSRGSIAVVLPEPILGAGPQLTIDAVSQVALGQMVVLPQVRVSGGLARTGSDDPSSGRVTLRISSPVQAQDLQLTGCRQTEVSSTENETKFGFRQMDPTSQIAIQVGQTSSRLAARTLTVIDTDADAWTGRTIADCRAVAGNLFGITLRVDPAWDVVDVRGDTSAEGILEWSEQDQNDFREVSVSFREPLFSGQSRRLVIDCRRSMLPGAPPDSLGLPVVAVDAVEGEVLTGLQDLHGEWIVPIGVALTQVKLDPMWSPLAAAGGISADEKWLWVGTGQAGARGHIERRVLNKPASEPRPTPENPRPAATAVPVVSRLEVTSRLVLEGADIYEAGLTLHSDGRPAVFACTLPAETTLLNARLAGREATPTRSGNQLLFSLPAGMVHQLELQYSCPARESLELHRRSIHVPSTASPVLSVGVNLHPGPDLWIGDEDGVRRDAPASWVPRWLGPLGRDPWVGGSGDDDSVIRLSSPALPLQFSVASCRRSRREMAAWSVFGLTFLMGLILRWSKSILGAWVGILGWLMLVPLMMLLSEATAIFAGAAHAGAWMAGLFPRRWMFPSVRLSGGSLPKAVAGVALATFACVTLAPVARGQPAEPDPIVVLIPVDDRELPAGETPLAYVPPSLEALLKNGAARSPGPAEWLIRKSEYRIQWRAGGIPVVSARFAVLVRPLDVPVAVLLPIRNASLSGDSPCRVDGAGHPVLPSPEGGYLVVLSPSRLPGGTESAPREEFQVRSIELELHPDTEAGETNLVQFTFPPVPSSIVSGPLSQVARVSGHASTGLSFEAKVPEGPTLDLGPIRSLRIRWGDEAALRVPAELVAQAATVVDPSAGSFEFQTQLACRVERGRCDAISLLLPEHAAVRSVHGTEILHWTVAEGNPQRRVQISLQRPQSSEFTVRIAWCLPRLPGAQPVTFRPPLVTSDHDSTSRAVPVAYLWAWRSGDWIVDVRPSTGEHAQPRTVDEFLSAVSVEGPRPGAAFSTIDATEILIGAQALPSEISAQPRQTISILRDRIATTFECEMIVRGAPVFMYRVSLPEATLVETVSVLQDGSEQVSHWSRAGGRLTVFLRDQVRGRQSLKVVASQSLSGSVSKTIDLWSLPGTHAGEIDVVLLRSPDLPVDVIGPESLLPIPLPDESRNPPGLAFVGAFRSVPGGTVQVRIPPPVLPELNVLRKCRLERTAKEWSIEWNLRFTAVRGRADSVGVRLPAELAPLSKVVSPGGALSRTRLPDGAESWIVPTELLPGESAELTVAATLPLRRDGGPMPQVVPLAGSILDDRVQLQSQRAKLVFESGRALGPGEESQGWHSLRVTPEARWIVQDTLPVTQQDAASESALWLTEHGLVGRTRLTASSSAAGYLEWDWPSAWTLDALIVDGRATVASPAGGKLRVELPPGAEDLRTVQIGWSAPVPDAGSRKALSLPQAPGPDPMLSLIVMPPEPNARMVISKTESSVHVQRYSRRMAAPVAAIGVAALAGLLVLLSARWGCLEAVQNRTWLATLVLAALWGAAFNPAWLGATFPFVALLERFVVTPPDVAPDVPSTIAGR